MSSPDERLADLRRQRAAIQDHLSWLDREIAAEERQRTGSPAPATPSAPVASPRSDLVTPDIGPTSADADEIIARYRTDSGDLQRDVRKGCLLYFVAACATLALAVVGLYVLLRHR